MAGNKNLTDSEAKFRLRLGIGLGLAALVFLGIGILSMSGAGFTVLIIVIGVLMLAAGAFAIYGGVNSRCALKEFMDKTSDVAVKVGEAVKEAVTDAPEEVAK